MKLRPLIKCHGGKWYLHQWIISHFPPNYELMSYVETHGGGASVLQNKKRSISETYNELDGYLVNLFWQLITNQNGFIDRVSTIPYCEASFKSALATTDADSTTQAIAELIARRMSRGGLKKHFAWSHRERGKQPGDVNAWETFKKQLPHIKKRWRGVVLLNEKAEDVIERLDSKEVLFYCDPPYLPSTRQHREAYNEFDMTEEDHIALANTLTQATGKVVLSGYPSELYDELYKGWKKVKKKVKNNSGQGKKKQDRTECLWLNF